MLLFLPRAWPQSISLESEWVARLYVREVICVEGAGPHSSQPCAHHPHGRLVTVYILSLLMMYFAERRKWWVGVGGGGGSGCDRGGGGGVGGAVD